MQNESELPQKQMCSASDKQQNSTFALFLHIVLLLPYIGWFITLIMWLIRKKQSPLVHQHGAAIANMVLSAIIYIILLGIASILLSLLETLLYVMIIYMFLIFMFIIVNAIRASNGEAASYPLAIPMFNTDLAKEALRVEDHLVD
jgi:uncharacterized protein